MERTAGAVMRGPAPEPSRRRARTGRVGSAVGLGLTTVKGGGAAFRELTSGCSIGSPLSSLDAPKEGT